MTWCLDSSGILPWWILPPTFIKPMWKIGYRLAIFELLCTEIPDDSALNSWGNDPCCISCKRSVLLEANSIAVGKLKLTPMSVPLFFTWRANVNNVEYGPQLIFDARLLCFLDVLVITLVSLFFKCSLGMLLSGTVSLFIICNSIYLRLSEATSLWRKSGPIYHIDLLVKLSNPL